VEAGKVESSRCPPEELRIRILSFDELRQRALSVYLESVAVPRSIRRQGRDRVRIMRYVLKCERVFQVVAAELGRIARLPRTTSMHPFYAEIANIASHGRFDEIVARAARGVMIVSKLWKEYRERILSSLTPAEAKRLAREFVGRTLSVARRSLRHAELLREAVKALRQTPCIDTESPLVIVAGMPQVGKSTLISRLSTAKPEISPYPFTTKHVILGHMEVDGHRIQLLDTPGLLDRPNSEMNPIERRAAAALRLLRAVTLFLIDPSRDSYYSIDKQLRVLRNVSEIVGVDNLLVVMNKVDKVDEGRLKSVEELVEEAGFQVKYRISALKGWGLGELVRGVVEELRRRGLLA